MATLNTNFPTLLDLAKRLDPDNKIASIAEVLHEHNEILADMVWQEGNLPTGHKTTIRTGLPEPTWRKLYGGVQPTKSTTAQVVDTIGNLEAYAEVDKDLADLNGNTNEFRLSEDIPHIEGINQEFVRALFYGNETTQPEAFTGFAPRFNSTTAPNGDNIIDAKGTGSDNQSIWLVVWGPNTVHGIVPKGSQAGLQFQDLGEVTLESAPAGGGRMQAYRSHYKLQAGLTVRDWRYVVRIANIDKDALLPDPSTAGAVNLPDLMFEALEAIPNLNMGQPVFYMSRQVLTTVRQQLSYRVANSTLVYRDVGGHRTAMFQDTIPMRRVDALAADEALVS